MKKVPSIGNVIKFTNLKMFDKMTTRFEMGGHFIIKVAKITGCA